MAFDGPSEFIRNGISSVINPETARLPAYRFMIDAEVGNRNHTCRVTQSQLMQSFSLSASLYPLRRSLSLKSILADTRLFDR